MMKAAHAPKGRSVHQRRPGANLEAWRGESSISRELKLTGRSSCHSSREYPGASRVWPYSTLGRLQGNDSVTDGGGSTNSRAAGGEPPRWKAESLRKATATVSPKPTERTRTARAGSESDI